MVLSVPGEYISISPANHRAMAGTGTSPLDRLRRPEYTGENRCVPCTIVNLVLTGLLGGAVAVVSPPLAALVVAASLLSIYFRGYLVPGTPTLTKRFLPERVLRLFDKHPAEESDGPDLEVFDRLEEEREHSVDPATFLQDVDAIELATDSEEFVFTDGFERAVADQRQRVRDGDERLQAVADIFGVDRDAVEPLDRDYPAFKIRSRIRKWPSRAALTADLAVDRALRERTDRWADVPATQRGEMLESLRGFQQSCPACGGPITFDESVVESCCGAHEVKTYACEDCGDRLREFDQARVGDDQSVKGVTP